MDDGAGSVIGLLCRGGGGRDGQGPPHGPIQDGDGAGAATLHPPLQARPLACPRPQLRAPLSFQSFRLSSTLSFVSHQTRSWPVALTPVTPQVTETNKTQNFGSGPCEDWGFKIPSVSNEVHFSFLATGAVTNGESTTKAKVVTHKRRQGNKRLEGGAHSLRPQSTIHNEHLWTWVPTRPLFILTPSSPNKDN